MNKIIISTIAIFFLFSAPKVFAGVTCTGTACTLIPSDIYAELNTIDASLKTQYTDKLLDSMAEAATLANLNGGMIGPGQVNRFQIGIGFAGSAVQKDNITVVHGQTTLPELPNVGASFTPVISAGVNLGWLLGGGAVDKKVKDANGKRISKNNFLHRFSLYVNGFSYDFDGSDIEQYSTEGLDMSGNITKMGAMLRFQIFKEKKTRFSIFGFNGLSVGLSYNVQNQAMNIVQVDTDIPTMEMGSVTATWAGENKIAYNSKIKSYGIDLRTGVRLFYFVNLFAGIGTSVNSGTVDLTVSREGAFRIGTELALASLDPALTSYLNESSSDALLDPEGYLTLSVEGHGKPINRMNYMIAGVEFNIMALKLLTEVYISEKTYAANLGVKMAF